MYGNHYDPSVSYFKHLYAATQAGSLQLFDIASSAMIEEIEAHTGAVWSLCVLPDKRGIVTGSADHEVKFWQFELVEGEAGEESGDSDEEEGRKGEKKSIGSSTPAAG